MEEKISSFLNHHNIVPKGQNARSFIFDCPACSGDRKLYIEKKDGRSVCFKGKSDKCPSPGSKVYYALSLLSGLSISAVRAEIVDFITQLSDEINVSFEEEKKVEGVDLPSVPLPDDVSFITDSSAEPGRLYLERRGITQEMQEKYSLMYSSSMRRAIFPVIMGGKLCGWQGRAIDPVDHSMRMHNAPGKWRSNALMFYDKLGKSEFVIVAEGPISALKFEKVGHFVATMGKEISKRQLEILKSHGIKKMYLALDRDAIDKTYRVRYHMDNAISGNIECFIVNVPDHRDDFGDCSFDECAEAFKSAEKITGDELFAIIDPKIIKNRA